MNETRMERNDMKHDNQSIQLIADHLMEQAEHDQQLRTAIDSMEANKKSLDEMWKYIISMAKRELDGKSGAIQDAKVFGWAIHYMTEPNENLELPKEVHEPLKSADVKPKVVEKRETVKTVKQTENVNKPKQLSMFDEV